MLPRENNNTALIGFKSDLAFYVMLWFWYNFKAYTKRRACLWS